MGIISNLVKANPYRVRDQWGLAASVDLSIRRAPPAAAHRAGVPVLFLGFLVVAYARYRARHRVCPVPSWSCHDALALPRHESRQRPIDGGDPAAARSRSDPWIEAVSYTHLTL